MPHSANQTAFAWRRIAPAALLSALSALAFAACSGKTEPTSAPGEEPYSENPNDHACLLGDCETIGTRATPLASPFCPEDEPSVGDACADTGVKCSYGDSPSSYCRRYVECVDDYWQTPRFPRTACESQREINCPSAPAQGEACVTNGTDYVPCYYDGGIMRHCIGNPAFDRSGRPGVWECYAPPRNGACPEVIPNLGTGCARRGQFCRYGIVELGCTAPYASVYCEQGQWMAAGAACAL